MNTGDRVLLAGVMSLIVIMTGIFVLHMTTRVSSEKARAAYGLVTIRVGGTPVSVELARTRTDQAQGLSGRNALPANRGMLFIFAQNGVYPIWMRAMRFPLDIYWINEQGRIVDMWQNARPESYPTIFTPKYDARYVLEVTAGFSEIYNIRVGDKVESIPR